MRQDRNTEDPDTEDPDTEDPDTEDPDVAAPPLTARSVVASMLLGMNPPESSGRMLVRSGQLFGVAEGTIRTALSRMLAAGELESAGNGRYRLAGPLLARQARQQESRRPALRRWRGDWRTAVVVAESRTPADRAALRNAMRSLRMAELREGCWLRPDNIDAPPSDPVAAQCRWFRSRPLGGPADAADLAARLWDLDGWSRSANRLLAAMEDSIDALHVGDDFGVLAPAFVLAASVLRHVQADPLLPDQLLPGDWPGGSLRARYEEYEAALQRLLRNWFRAERER